MNAAETAFVIWSHQHHAYWRPDRQGYTVRLADAGRYTEQETAKIVLYHVPMGEEVAIPDTAALNQGEERIQAYIYRPRPEDT